MSHLHLPDGVLPAWLWLSGFAVALVWVGLVCAVSGRRADLRRRVPRIAIVAAFMLVAMSLEIVPLAYHFNLSIIGGALLGPLLAPVAALIVVSMLALMGHGGVTVIGLNMVLVAVEMSVGGWMFRGLRGVLRGAESPTRTGIAGGLAVLVTLPLSTGLMLFITSLGLPLGVLPETVAVLGPIGWVLEAVLTGLVLSYIAKVRPSLLGGRRDTPPLHNTDGTVSQERVGDAYHASRSAGNDRNAL
jgi:ABC-type Co2+ transport system permease subunit